MLLGKADALLAERARMAVSDALAPIYGVLAAPLASVRSTIDNTQHMLTLFSDNARLREENERLRKWQAVAMTLDAENALLKANLAVACRIRRRAM
jgi:rod shape-determining protein MreC